ASAVTAAAVSLAVGPFWAVLAYRIPATNNAVQALFDLGNLGYNFIGFPLSLFIVCSSVRMMKHPPSRWLGWIGLPVAAVQAIAAGSVAKSGFFSPGGGVFLVAFAGFALWVVGVSVSLLLRAEREPRVCG